MDNKVEFSAKLPSVGRATCQKSGNKLMISINAPIQRELNLIPGDVVKVSYEKTGEFYRRKNTSEAQKGYFVRNKPKDQFTIGGGKVEEQEIEETNIPEVSEDIELGEERAS